MTSLRGPGERNFNAISHKPTRAPIQFNSMCSRQLWFMGYGIKISFPRPPHDVTDHLERVGRSVLEVCKKAQKDQQMYFMDVKKS